MRTTWSTDHKAGLSTQYERKEGSLDDECCSSARIQMSEATSRLLLLLIKLKWTPQNLVETQYDHVPETEAKGSIRMNKKHKSSQWIKKLLWQHNTPEFWWMTACVCVRVIGVCVCVCVTTLWPKMLIIITIYYCAKWMSGRQNRINQQQCLMKHCVVLSYWTMLLKTKTPAVSMCVGEESGRNKRFVCVCIGVSRRARKHTFVFLFPTVSEVPHSYLV